MRGPTRDADGGERDGVLTAGEKNCAFGAKDCFPQRARPVTTLRKQCRDLYSRDADTPAEQVGRGWLRRGGDAHKTVDTTQSGARRPDSSHPTRCLTQMRRDDKQRMRRGWWRDHTVACADGATAVDAAGRRLRRPPAGTSTGGCRRCWSSTICECVSGSVSFSSSDRRAAEEAAAGGGRRNGAALLGDRCSALRRPRGGSGGGGGSGR